MPAPPAPSVSGPAATAEPEARLPLPEARELLRHGGSLEICGLRGSSPALLLAALAAGHDGPLLWVVPDRAAAQVALSELRVFIGDSDHLLAMYPDWDVPAYGGYSPSSEVTWRRLAILHALAARRAPLVVAPAPALLKRVLPREALLRAADTLRAGSTLLRDALLHRLVERGYLRTELASEPGSFAIRGGVLDVFTPSHPAPLRIETWGDEIESVRSFDPGTQRSLGTLSEALLLPVREEILDDATRAALPVRLKELADSRGLQPRVRIELQRDLEGGRVLQELELLLPLLQPDIVPVAELLGPRALVVWQDPHAIESALYGESERLRSRWASHGGHERLLPEPSALFLDEDALQPSLRAAAHSFLRLPELDLDSGPGRVRVQVRDHAGLRPELLAARDHKDGMLAPLAARIRRWSAEDRAKVALVSGSRSHARQLSELLQPYGIEPRESGDVVSASALLDPGSDLRRVPGVDLLKADISRGFDASADGIVLLAADEVLGQRPRAATRARTAGHEAVGSLSQLKPSDLVVHALHGIGRYMGLTKLQLGASVADVQAEQRSRALDPGYRPGSVAPLRVGADRASEASAASGTPEGRGAPGVDYLLLEYQAGDRLYLPVHKLDLLARYVSPGGALPKLDQLGGQTWQKRKKKAAEDAQKVAKELLDLYARRQLARARPYREPDTLFAEFCAGFPWEETPDQQAAVDAVLKDLESPRPMDRLVVGDVGFGKTEVAMRAAFLAVEQARQVAVLVPTTLLALQHHEAFAARMEPFGIRVDMLSRLRGPSEQRRTLAALAEGKVDVVVGTHRLLGRDVLWKDLGLLVVDEEHRFGVKHKERIRELKSELHVLTLSATPIPRTLHMALSGIRDFSIITTPPEGRQSVRTSVARFSTSRIDEAVRHELERGGQVFFVHNRVQTIHKMADLLRKLLPGVGIRTAHGQMASDELEDIMLDFYQRRFQVLLSTTIVESGIDVPTANTIVINRADTLGLAQLHQLRGRVGRARERGFCLLLVPPGRALHRGSLERLRVIQDHADLGAGHRIAQHDLEIRGAGNLLGRDQSGHSSEVGLATYLELLEAAVRRLRGQRGDVGPEPDVDLRADAFIPSDYVPDEGERLLEYKRLCDARTLEELRDLFGELEDRYGHPPDEVKRFEDLIETKVLCRELRILSVRMARGGRMQFSFDSTTPVDPARLLARVQADPRRVSFKPEGVLLLSLDEDDRRRPAEAARDVLRRLLLSLDTHADA